jgi:hypothetical protein
MPSPELSWRERVAARAQQAAMPIAKLKGACGCAVKRVTRQDNVVARALLEKAIAIDPNYGQALAQGSAGAVAMACRSAPPSAPSVRRAVTKGPSLDPPDALNLKQVDTMVTTIMIEKEPEENQSLPSPQHPNTTELAGFMKVNDTPGAGR